MSKFGKLNIVRGWTSTFALMVIIVLATQVGAVSSQEAGGSGLESLGVRSVVTLDHRVAASWAGISAAGPVHRTTTGNLSDTAGDPNIDVDPLAIGSRQDQDRTVTVTLDISNRGGAPLEWRIEEKTGSNCRSPSDIPWLSVAPDMGTTVVRDTTTIDVIFDSTGLAPGAYNGSLCIFSDDPDPGPGNGTELVVVVIELVVEEASQPNIDVDPLGMGSRQEPDQTVTVPLDISNRGGAQLEWRIEETNGSNCQSPSDIPWLSVAPDMGTTAVSDRTTIDVIFDSTGLTPSTYDGYLCIRSDDPDPGPGNETELVVVVIELVVEEASQPNIDVDPLGMGSRQEPDQTVIVALDISNRGGAPLEWRIEEANGTNCQSPSDIPWLSVAPDMGTTAVSDRTTIDVSFDSTGLASGATNGSLCIFSNDPDAGSGNGTELVVVPVVLIVGRSKVYLPYVSSSSGG